MSHGGDAGEHQRRGGTEQAKPWAHHCLCFLHTSLSGSSITSQKGRTMMESCRSHHVLSWSHVGASCRTPL